MENSVINTGNILHFLNEPTIENVETKIESDLQSFPIISPTAVLPKLSKNAIKKAARLERITKQRKENRKREKERRKENGTANLAIKRNADGETVKVHRKSLKNNLMANSKCKLRITIDCSFENMMSDSDISHLGKQLSYSYAKNRRMESPLQFYVTSCVNKTQELLEKSGLSNWDIHLHEKHYLDVFSDVKRENICYLTSDSSNVIDDFDENTVYIIGGLVDHNHYKSHCYDLAIKENISHAQLPIGKFMHMKTRQVLTVNQVYEIIASYCECKDWMKAFVDVLPKRKGAKEKDQNNDNDKNLEEQLLNEINDQKIEANNEAEIIKNINESDVKIENEIIKEHS